MAEKQPSPLHEGLIQLDQACFERPAQALLRPAQCASHPPQILLLYGSLRERSYSKLLTL
jgi:arsenic resistance protein ArsH